MIDQMIERAKRLIESEPEQTLAEYELFSLLEQMQQELKQKKTMEILSRLDKSLKKSKKQTILFHLSSLPMDIVCLEN